ncbi:MAG: SPFH domain-containing protein [Catonella sp.]|jgi:membrane protease subunit (stomatin/prohibitin family)|nr:SPFH domain-containing protein [Catonella sp.]MDY6355741.1 SPFH domain-containing protein [Catonella sp.]
MGLLNQFSSVVEWNNAGTDVLFHKIDNCELKKGSVLFIRPGQAAFIFNNGALEGRFDQAGRLPIESDVIPFLSTLKGFKFGFRDTGLRCEVLFINTKGINVTWGTPNPVNVPMDGFPGGVPIRANGTVVLRVANPEATMTSMAGTNEFTVDDARQYIDPLINQILITTLSNVTGGMAAINANAMGIAEAAKKLINDQFTDYGLVAEKFLISSVTYPKEVQDMVNKVAGQGMIGNMERYQQTAFADSMAKGGSGANAAGFAGIGAGLAMGANMANGLIANGNAGAVQNQAQSSGGSFCPQCGAPVVAGDKFCRKCGAKLQG